MIKNISLSIIIPVYNEKENILKTLQEIKKHINVSHEILIVYDFKGDTTLEVLKKVKKNYKNLYAVQNSIVRGPSGAIRTGILQSKGDLILVTMADLCDDLTQVPRMIKMIPKKASIVCPSRYMKGGQQQLKPSLKVFAPRTAGALLKILGGIPTYDPTNSYKLYSRKIFETIDLKSTVSFSVTLEIVVKAVAKGYKVVEIPTVWRDRQHGKTNFKLWRSIVAYFPWFLYAILNRIKFLTT